MGLICILVIVFILLMVSFVGNYVFRQQVNKEIDEFLNAQKEVAMKTIRLEDIEHLPTPVKNWLKKAGAIDSESIHTARSKQTALVRLDKTTDNWLPLEADQYFTVNEPGFLWKAKFKIAPFIHIVGKDKYHHGKGQMLIKFQSLLTIADATGYEIDQGSLVRYLAEIVWVPTAALAEYITWEEIDQQSSKATIDFEGVSATGVFTFDDDGNPIHFVADRYGEFDGKFMMQPWSIKMHDHQFVNGFKVPFKAEITWKLDSGDYTWYSLELKELEFNRATRFKMN